MDLPGNHEDAHFYGPTLSVSAAKKHVKAAFVGTKRVKQKRKVQEGFRIRREGLHEAEPHDPTEQPSADVE
jgi:hypothetical protein